MSTLSPTSPVQPAVPPPRAARSARALLMLTGGKLYLALLLLLLPTLIGQILFTYWPQIAAIKYAFYKWDGQQIEEFRGLENFRTAFGGDPLFWHTFKLTFILLLANLLKMWPSMFTAIVIHHLRSERWQYLYRVLLVIPMVIPGLVWLLLWKSFYDPSYGILNQFLNTTGLMSLLAWADVHMPLLAAALTPARHLVVDLPFGNVWGMLLVAVMLFSAAGGWKQIRRAWGWWLLLGLTGVVVWKAVDDAIAYLPIWTGVALGSSMLVHGGKALLISRRIRILAAILLSVATLFLLTSMIWTEPTGAFVTGTPAWLAHTRLIIPSILFWGFPWIGTVGVLIYLAGLQNIPGDVYEAAEIDGVGSWGKIFRIELPLIMTQVRINLIFMTIGTITDYGLFLLLLGPEGGPGGVGMVPGLYAYRQAFVDGEFGYACALGLVMFLIIMAITLLYQRYVKVDK